MNNFKFLILAALLFSFNAIAQEDEPTNLNEINNKKHELRIDALEGLAIPALDLSYEYVLSKYSGFGVSLNVAFEDENEFNIDQKFSVTPYYRQYFFNKKDYGARGFFAEGSLQFATGESTTDFIFNTNTGGGSVVTENWSQFGVGFALGQKWVSRNGFVIELLVGGGRYLGSDEVAPGGFFRGGLNVGYRF